MERTVLMNKSFLNIKKIGLSIVTIAVLTFVSLSHGDEVYSKNQKANNLYKQGKHDDALKLYDDALLLSPSDSKLKMNKGSALYQTGQFDKAEELYNSALSVDDKKAKADAHYNMGNILFRQGELLQKSGNPSSKEKYQAALQNFIQTLDLRPSDPDAKWNLQLAHNRIKQVEQEQKQQQNKNDKNDKNDQSKNDKDKQQNKNQKKNDQKQNDDQSKNQKEQDKKDQDKKNEQDKQQQQQKEQQNQSQQQQQQAAQDMKKEEAKRLIELYADDADSLNKPPKKANASRQAKPEQDW
jgi:tetratricopeptide (TPR) repeat protein